jgi:hypothetical protein
MSRNPIIQKNPNFPGKTIENIILLHFVSLLGLDSKKQNHETQITHPEPLY